MNYRQKYKKHYGIKFGSDFDVHHIDLNHDNDDIKNLLLLPKKLHQQYHFLLLGLPVLNGEIQFSPEILSVTQSGYKANSYLATVISQFVDVYEECQKWADYKSYLDGNIPNIHNITIGGVAR